MYFKYVFEILIFEILYKSDEGSGSPMRKTVVCLALRSPDVYFIWTRHKRLSLPSLQL